MFDGSGTMPVKPKLAEVKRVVARAHGLETGDLESQLRIRKYAQPRQLAAYLCRELTDHSYPEIGRAFGDRDHTTILFAYRKIAAQAAHDEKLASQVNDYRHQIHAIAALRWEGEKSLRALVPLAPPKPGRLHPYRRMDSRWWTTEQINTLRNMRADGTPYSLIAERLGRSMAAVENKAGELGIRSPDAAMRSLQVGQMEHAA